jgi:hypothetical protein
VTSPAGEKTRDELAAELAETCAELEECEDHVTELCALLSAFTRRYGGSVVLRDVEIAHEGQVAFGAVQDGVLVFVPGCEGAKA